MSETKQQIDVSEPAFPVTTRWDEEGDTYGHQDGPSTWQFPGMSQRQYAAIQLRVPDSGTPWLDDMIREARRLDLAAKVMSAILQVDETSNPDYRLPKGRCADIKARDAYAFADAMLAASRKEGGE